MRFELFELIKPVFDRFVRSQRSSDKFVQPANKIFDSMKLTLII